MPAPANDNFASAVDLGGESGSLAGTTVDATGEASIATIGAILVENGRDVWYKVHAGYFVCNSTPNPGFPYAVWTTGASFRHQIRVYALDNTGTLKRYQSSGVGNPGFGQNEICQYFPSESDYFPGADELLSPHTPADYPNAWIYIQVDAVVAGDAGGTFTLNWGRSPMPALGPVDSFKAWMTPHGKTVTFCGMAAVNSTSSTTAYFNSGNPLPEAFSPDYYRIAYAGGAYAVTGVAGAPDAAKSSVYLNTRVTFNSTSTFTLKGDESTPMPGFMDATDLSRLEIQNGYFTFATFQQIASVIKLDVELPYPYGTMVIVVPDAWPLWSAPYYIVTSAPISELSKDATFALWRIHG